MSGMEFNKLFAAILVAGILAMLAGFVASHVVQVEKPEKNAYPIEVAEDAGAPGAAKEAVAEPILALLKTADVAKGQNIAKACGACHSFNKGEPARVGPNLYGIVGNRHAHMEGFAYSDAMKAMHDKTWNYNELNVFIWNPRKHIAGTKMVFAGLKKPQDRADVIAYLRTLADSPVALPSDADIAAEAVEAAPAADAAAKTEEAPKVDANAAPAAAPAAKDSKPEAKAGTAKKAAASVKSTAKADVAKASAKVDAVVKSESKKLPQTNN